MIRTCSTGHTGSVYMNVLGGEHMYTLPKIKSRIDLCWDDQVINLIKKNADGWLYICRCDIIND